MALEAGLPHGVRARQLSARTLLVGMLVALAEGRPAQLTRVHAALSALPEADRARLGVVSEWRTGPHTLSYRQVEHTARLLAASLAKACPDGQPSAALARFSAALLEASVPERAKATSAALAVDWTDMESFACPPVPEVRPSVDPEASWGHRRGHGPGQKDELFFGYYLSAATMVNEEAGPAVPELVRRATLSSCHVDPVPAFVPALRGPGQLRGGPGRRAGRLRLRPPGGRALGPAVAGAGGRDRDRPAPRLTAAPGAPSPAPSAANGNLYCPATPPGLLGLVPLARDASAQEIAVHDQRTAELAHYKLARTGRRRPRRLPPGGLSRRHGEIALPPASSVHDAVA